LVKIDDPKAIQYMQSVYKSSKRLARLVADLLNVSRIEQGRMMVLKKETDLATLIDEVVKELKFKVEEKKHKLLTSIRQNIDTHIYADEDKIKEVIINLTGNSIKYTKDGGLIGIGVDVWPTSEVEKRFGIMHNELKEHGKTAEGALLNIVDPHFAQLVGDKQLVIIVKDNGIGITHEDMGRLFQKFSRVGDWSTQEVQGTGLGLYISRALVEMHHGRIWVESKGEGKGCTFYFSLPLIKVEDEEKKLDAEVPIAADAKPLAKSGS
jgi:signal transduction histidine kinase